MHSDGEGAIRPAEQASVFGPKFPTGKLRPDINQITSRLCSLVICKGASAVAVAVNVVEGTEPVELRRWFAESGDVRNHAATTERWPH
jgi:hypothetical protein